jgi:hypothetical protein
VQQLHSHARNLLQEPPRLDHRLAALLKGRAALNGIPIMQKHRRRYAEIVALISSESCREIPPGHERQLGSCRPLLTMEISLRSEINEVLRRARVVGEPHIRHEAGRR